MATHPKVSICLWHDGAAEEAADSYTSLNLDSRIESIARIKADGPALPVNFTLGGASSQGQSGGRR